MWDATYVAGLLAGYNQEDATTIAHAGEYVDDNEPSRLIDNVQIFGKKPFATALPLLDSIARMNDWSDLTIAHDRGTWTAFHFLPGNLEYACKYEGPMSHTATFTSWKYDRLADEQFRSLCLPDSPLAIAMINDTVDNHANDLHMIGIRMHVLIDTFAHTFFCGSAAWHVNDVNFDPKMRIEDDWASISIPIFNYTPPEFTYNGISYTGHGRMGHIPDYPWITYKYKPQWSKVSIIKDNPTMYRRAFQEMVLAMTCIRKGERYEPPKENQFLDSSDASIRATAYNS